MVADHRTPRAVPLTRKRTADCRNVRRLNVPSFLTNSTLPKSDLLADMCCLMVSLSRGICVAIAIALLVSGFAGSVLCQDAHNLLLGFRWRRLAPEARGQLVPNRFGVWVCPSDVDLHCRCSVWWPRLIEARTGFDAY